MTYWTWNGMEGDEPTMHVYEYGLFNIWEDGLTVEDHWMDADPPTLKPDVLEDIKNWKGVWCGPCLQVIFDNGNDAGAMLWKMKYTSKSGCTSRRPDDNYTENGVIVLKGAGVK